jgi:uncharacterized protein
MQPSIAYLDGRRLRLALITASEHVQSKRAELNRINVFPVPDGDTGTNLALTVSSIADGLRHTRERSVGSVARTAAEAGIMGARGNCGMILSHFLLGFADAVGQRSRLSVVEFAEALREAVQHLYAALEKPVEGTIITVMRETADMARDTGTEDFAVLVRELLDRANDALARTPDQLPVLRIAGVVDAGAKGYVHLLEGIAASVTGDPLLAPAGDADYGAIPPAAASVRLPDISETYRFCTEGLVRGEGLPAQDEVRDSLRGKGDSMVVICTGDVLKVHIHTDEPEAVFEYLRGLGTLVAHKAEDMQVQHDALARAGHLELARRPVSLVTDSACDLSQDVIRAHGIHVVPLTLIFDGQPLRDGVDITAQEFTRRLLEGEHPSTSQPPPAAFLEAYRRAAEDGEAVIAVTLSAALSGTYASAETAARGVVDTPIHRVDSRGATLTQGLLVLRAAELAERGMPPAEIVPELVRIRNQSGILFTVDTFDRLLASGRVSRGRAWLGTLLDIKPILGLDQEGRVEPIARVRGRSAVLPRMLELLAERIPTDASRLRFGVIHVAAEETAHQVAEALRERFGEREILVAPATAVIATHTGAGTWGIAYQLED